jgi:hypothetical protein
MLLNDDNQPAGHPSARPHGEGDLRCHCCQRARREKDGHSGGGGGGPGPGRGRGGRCV